MRYLVWALRLLVFIAVLLFALKNTEPVTVRFYADHLVSQVPLIVVMLATFVAGGLFGLLLTVPAGIRRRRELARVRKELERLKAAQAAPHDKPISPDEMVPLSPL